MDGISGNPINIPSLFIIVARFFMGIGVDVICYQSCDKGDDSVDVAYAAYACFW